MRTIVRGGAIAGALALFALVSGCGNDSGQVAFRWSLEDAQTRTPLACAPGDTVQATIGGVSFSFDCVPMAGITPGIPSGDYDVTFDFVDGSGRILSTAVVPVTVLSGGVNDIGDIVFLVNTQVIAAAHRRAP